MKHEPFSTRVYVGTWRGAVLCLIEGQSPSMLCDPGPQGDNRETARMEWMELNPDMAAITFLLASHALDGDVDLAIRCMPAVWEFIRPQILGHQFWAISGKDLDLIVGSVLDGVTFAPARGVSPVSSN